jgi:hypothetical protein
MNRTWDKTESGVRLHKEDGCIDERGAMSSCLLGAATWLSFTWHNRCWLGQRPACRRDLEKFFVAGFRQECANVLWQTID